MTGGAKRPLDTGQIRGGREGVGEGEFGNEVMLGCSLAGEVKLALQILLRDLQERKGMVRPERRVRLADERSVRVSVGAPGSRPQPGGEILTARAGRQKPVKEQGARKRAATLSERCSHVILSAERCLKGPSRSCHGEGNRQQTGPNRLLDLSGVAGGGTFLEKNAEQERPYLAVESDKDRGYKAGRLKASGAGRESEGFIVPMKACKITRWREGALL
jgi:hypothetical protein